MFSVRVQDYYSKKSKISAGINKKTIRAIKMKPTTPPTVAPIMSGKLDEEATVLVDLDNIKDLYLKQKIKFIKRLKQNELTNKILIHLIENEKKIEQKTTTYVKDLRTIAKSLQCNIGECISEEKKRNELLKTVDINKEEDEVIDSIRYCFYNFTNKRHKDLLYLLTKAFFWNHVYYSFFPFSRYFILFHCFV